MSNSNSKKKESDFSGLSASKAESPVEAQLITGGYKMKGRPPRIKRARNPKVQGQSAFTSTRVKDKKNKPYEPPADYPDATPGAWVEPFATAAVATNQAAVKAKKSKGKGFAKDG
jgi:hypothetical protein